MKGIALMLMAAAALAAQDWPRFRGPNGTGISDSGALPVEFGAAKNLAWKTAAPFSRSSPIVAGSRVYLTAVDGEKLTTLSLDALTGKILWRREIARERAHKIYRLNDSAAPTPASDGRNVYVFFPDLGLVSYGPDGNERWRRPLGPFHNFYGMSASPIVAGDKIILACDQQTGSFLVAVDRNDGRIRWRVERPGSGASYATPVLYSPKGESPAPVLVNVGWDRVDGYSPETGERFWWFRKTGISIYGTPVLAGDRLFFHGEGFDKPEIPMFDAFAKDFDSDRDNRISREELNKDKNFGEQFDFFDNDGNGFIEAKEWNALLTSTTIGDYGMHAIRLGGRGDLTATNLLWRFKKNLPQVPSPVLYKEVLYMVKNGGIITSLNLATGQVYKEGRAEGALGTYYSSPVAGDGKVYLVSEDGKVTVLKAGPQWEVLAVNDLGEECYATPAIAAGRLYIRTRAALYCFRPL